MNIIDSQIITIQFEAYLRAEAEYIHILVLLIAHLILEDGHEIIYQGLIIILRVS